MKKLNRFYETMQRQAGKIQTSSGNEVDSESFENLVKEIVTDIDFNEEGNVVLMHDSNIISNQTPLSLGIMKGPIEIVKITATSEAVNGSITSEQLKTLQFSDMNMIMFNNEIYTLMDKDHVNGYLTYSHIGFENNLTYIKTFTITINNLTWVLNINPIPKFDYDEENKTLNIIG